MAARSTTVHLFQAGIRAPCARDPNRAQGRGYSDRCPLDRFSGSRVRFHGVGLTHPLRGWAGCAALGAGCAGGQAGEVVAAGAAAAATAAVPAAGGADASERGEPGGCIEERVEDETGVDGAEGEG